MRRLRVSVLNGLGSVWGAFPPNVLESTTRTVGGGECAMLQTSFGLVALGHDVTLYCNGDDAEYKGVHFRSLNRRLEALDSDAVVSWSDDDILRLARPGTRRVYSQQLNHMPTDLNFWQSVDVIVSPSRWHASYLGGFAPPGATYRFVIMPSGIDHARYVNAPPWSSRPPVVSYWSSPDRGLEHLLVIWPEVAKAVPGAELRVFYHFQRFVDFAAAHWGAPASLGRPQWTISARAEVMRQLAERSGAKFYGAVPRSVLAGHQMQTKVLAYPFDPVAPTEGFCTALGEGLAAGCRVVARPDDALEEVWGEGARWVRSAVCGPEFRARFRDVVIDALTAPVWPEDQAAREISNSYTWERATERLNRAITVELPAEVAA